MTDANATAATAAPKPKAEPKAKPATLFVLDTTALPDNPPRVHEIVVDGRRQAFKFEAGKPVEMAYAIALKFLRIEEFKRTDKDGNILDFRRSPKQPEDLQAGEAMVLADDETIARFDELTTIALQNRVLPMVGGEKFADAPSRDAMVEFLAKAKAAAKAAKAPSEFGADDFVPEAEAA